MAVTMDQRCPYCPSLQHATCHLTVLTVLTARCSFRLHETWGTMHEGEGDEMKVSAWLLHVTWPPDTVLQRIFVEGDPILLAITGCVSVLHTLFDMLRSILRLPAPPPIVTLFLFSFKNDISFWKGVKSMQGTHPCSISLAHPPLYSHCSRRLVCAIHLRQRVLSGCCVPVPDGQRDVVDGAVFVGLGPLD